MSCDKLVFDLSQEVEGSPNVFIRKDWINILDNQTNTAIFTFDASLIKAMKVDYTIIRGNTVRTGSFVIVASTDGTGGNLATSDTTATQNSSTGVTLSAVESSSTVTFRYSSTSIATAGIMRYSVQRLG